MGGGGGECRVKSARKICSCSRIYETNYVLYVSVCALAVIGQFSKLYCKAC